MLVLVLVVAQLSWTSLFLVDTIWNHMAGLDSGSGTAGSSFTKYNYPGIYQNQDFHTCRHGINDWNNASEIQTCELAGLAECVRYCRLDAHFELSD